MSAPSPKLTASTATDDLDCYPDPQPGDRKRYRAWAILHGVEPQWDAADAADLNAYIDVEYPA
jgi:hypothetical protein